MCPPLEAVFAYVYVSGRVLLPMVCTLSILNLVFTKTSVSCLSVLVLLVKLNLRYNATLIHAISDVFRSVIGK